MIGLEFFKDHFVLLNSRILDQKKKKKKVLKERMNEFEGGKVYGHSIFSA